MNTIETKRGELVSRREQLITHFAETARAPGEVQLSPIVNDITFTREFIDTLERIAGEAKSKPPSLMPRFVVSSYFLHDAYKRLCADENEQFYFITGMEVEGVKVLDQIIEMEHDRRTPGGVTANHGFTHKLLIKLEQFGHRLLATFHSHPGSGANGTFPSIIDKDFQRRLESGGHQALMAIFSRDGFIRFVRLDNNFEVEIYGQGVERHDNHIYRLTNLDQA